MEENNHPIYEGTIGYKLIMNPKGWQIEFDSTLENDIASLGIARYVLDLAVAGFETSKKKAKGNELKSIKALLDRSTKARFGLAHLGAYYQQLYPIFKKAVSERVSKEKQEDAKIVSIIKDNGKED